MGETVKLIVLGASLGVNWLLVGPFVAYWAFLYWKMRGHPLVKRRFVHLTMAHNLLSLLLILLERPVNAWYYMNHLEDTPIGVTSDCFLVIVTHGFAYAVLSRAWLMMYQTYWNKLKSEGRWKKQLNDEWLEHNFWSAHRSTLGSERFMTFRLYPAVWALSATVTCMATVFATRNIYYVVLNSVMYALPILMMCACYFFTPEFHDRFRVRDEIRNVSLVSALGLVIFLATNQLGLSRVTMSVLRTFVLSYVFVVISLFSTIWVLQFSGVIKKKDRWRGRSLFSLDLEPCTETQMTDQKEEDSKSRQFMPLYQLLSLSTGVDVFMAYLIKEFSSENLLCVIELKQFLDLLKHDIYVNLGLTDPEVDAAMSLIKLHSDAVPKSKIVCDESTNLSQKAVLFTKKYIYSDSEYMVNVSGKVNRELVLGCEQGFEQHTAEQMYTLFGYVLIQLQRLMNDSYNRFVGTRGYAAIEQHIESHGSVHLPEPNALAPTKSGSADVRSTVVALFKRN